MKRYNRNKERCKTKKTNKQKKKQNKFIEYKK